MLRRLMIFSICVAEYEAKDTHVTKSMGFELPHKSSSLARHCLNDDIVEHHVEMMPSLQDLM